jgi:Spy/CpxP family protein refolding chaperone
MEGMSMVWHRIAVLAVAVLAVVAGGGRLTADEPKDKRHDRLEALATKLGLSDQQKEEIRKVHQDFDKKADPVEHQVWALIHEEREAVRKVLTDEQRAKLPEVIKEFREKMFQTVAGKLDLSKDQKQKIHKIYDEYEPKFRELTAQKDKTEETHKQFRELRHQFVDAIRSELTDEQRAKLPAVLREEHHLWRNPTARREHLKELADKLGVSADQKEQLQKIYAEFDKKVEKPMAEVKQLHKDEHEAIEKVLTEEQRTKWRELRKSRGLDEKKE